MKTFLQNKGILAVIVLFLLAMFLYNTFFKSEEVSLPSESQTFRVGDDLLKIFGDLQRVSLDQNIFSSLGYILLTDFSVSIPQQATGRPNPFDIIGRD